MKRFLLILIFLTPTPYCLAEYKVGDSVSGKYVVEETTVTGKKTLYEIPLPNGDWQVVKTTQYKSRPTGISAVGSEVPMRSTSLAKVDQANKLIGYLYIVTNESTKGYKWIDEPCKKSGLIFKNTYGTELYSQRCLTISLNTFLEGTVYAQQQIRD